MADESFALTVPGPPATAADYDTMCAAVMETGRGRWFLEEFARRNRHADTQMLLAALERIEAAVRREPSTDSVEPIGASAVVTEETVSWTVRFDTTDTGPNAAAQDLALALESATAAIRSATDRLHDISWSLRERQYDDKFCDEIDARTTEITRACVVLDVTADAAHDLADLVSELESRVDAGPAAQADITPQDSAPAFETAQPDEPAPARDMASPWDETPGHGTPDEAPVPPAEELPQSVWDEDKRLDAFEPETAMSLWQLLDEAKAAGADAEPSPPAHTAAPAISDPGTRMQGPSMPQDITPDEESPQAAEPAGTEAPIASRSDEALFTTAAGHYEPPRVGWLSALLSRKARGETMLEEIPEDNSGVRDVDQTIIASPPEAFASPAELLPDPKPAAPPQIVDSSAPPPPAGETTQKPGSVDNPAGPEPHPRDPLGPIRQMSDEEKIALFT